MRNQKNKVIIVSSQFLIIESLKALLHEEGQYTVTGIINDRNLIVSAMNEQNVNLLIIDIDMLGENRISELYNIRVHFSSTPILLFTFSLIKLDIHELTKTGIRNIIFKTANREEILLAIESTIKGKQYYPDEVLDLLLENGNNKNTDEPVHLTETELEVVRFIAGGMTSKEIAMRKNVSFHTVNTHRKNIFKKLSVSNTSELIMYSIKAGWIDNIEYYI
jgi:DNA-binding NarL/FixJ family response regulator